MTNIFFTIGRDQSSLLNHCLSTERRPHATPGGVILLCKGYRIGGLNERRHKAEMMTEVTQLLLLGCLYTMSTHDGYQLGKPMQGKMTNRLFVDDLKVYAKSKQKLIKVLSDTKSQMMDAGLVWRDAKCAVLHLKRGKVVEKDGDNRLNEEITLKCLENQPYKFLGMPETDIHNTDKLIQLLNETISQGTDVIWASPLSHFNEALATNMFAMSLVNYFMWSQRINTPDLRKIDAAVRSIINDVYAKHKTK